MDIVKFIKKEMRNEASAISESATKIDNQVKSIVNLLLECKGKTVLSGMGKMGIIARKISATLTSTGTTSIFLHAAEGNHGDLGMLTKGDIIIILSYSGQTSEILSMIPYLKFLNIPIIAITGQINSSLAKYADFVLDCSVKKEYEPFGIVPTASTIVALSIGNAISTALLKKRSFKEDDFARFHPGGSIGKKLLLKVKDLMHKDKENPLLLQNAKMDEVLIEMTSKGLGCTNLVDENNFLTGIITDGDLRRIITKDKDFLTKQATDFMTKSPKTTTPSTLAIRALEIMETFKITMLPVIDKDNKSLGIIHMHDLINAGII